MSAIVVSDKFADAILVFCLRSDSLRLLTCVAMHRLPVRLLGRLLSLRLPAGASIYLHLVLSICVLQISVRMRHVTFVDSYLTTNIEFRNKACTLGKYYSYTEVIFSMFTFIYVYRHIYVCHVVAVALASLP